MGENSRSTCNTPLPSRLVGRSACSQFPRIYTEITVNNYIGLLRSGATLYSASTDAAFGQNVGVSNSSRNTIVVLINYSSDVAHCAKLGTETRNVIFQFVSHQKTACREWRHNVKEYL
jgi:hypothetical protein